MEDKVLNFKGTIQTEDVEVRKWCLKLEQDNILMKEEIYNLKEEIKKIKNNS
jgi:hypothetical protein